MGCIYFMARACNWCWNRKTCLSMSLSALTVQSICINLSHFWLALPRGCSPYTETETSSFLRNCHHWLYRKLSSPPWWRHQMERFSALLAHCAGNSPVTVEFPSQRPVTRRFNVFFFIYAWTNGWVNNRSAGDWRCHHAHYNVIVMQRCSTAESVFIPWRQQGPIHAHIPRCSIPGSCILLAFAKLYNWN